MCNITNCQGHDVICHEMGVLEGLECRYALRGQEVSSFIALNIHMITASHEVREKKKKSVYCEATRKGPKRF